MFRTYPISTRNRQAFNATGAPSQRGIRVVRWQAEPERGTFRGILAELLAATIDLQERREREKEKSRGNPRMNRRWKGKSRRTVSRRRHIAVRENEEKIDRLYLSTSCTSERLRSISFLYFPRFGYNQWKHRRVPHAFVTAARIMTAKVRARRGYSIVGRLARRSQN